jgi:serine/threonine protein kinase
MSDLAAWLSAVHKGCAALSGPLEDDYGVEEAEDLLVLTPEEVEALVSTLKPVPARKFRAALEALAIDAALPGDAAGGGPKSIPEAVPPGKPEGEGIPPPGAVAPEPQPELPEPEPEPSVVRLTARELQQLRYRLQEERGVPPEPDGRPGIEEPWTKEWLLGCCETASTALQAALTRLQPGRWTVGTKLGTGSGGVVMQCADGQLGKVAIKFICCCTSTDRQRLQREVKLMHRAAHSHVCQCFEHHELHGGLFALVLELLDQTLCQVVKQMPNSRLSETTVTQMSLQILAALQHLHEKDVIHRDIKTTNIVRSTAMGPGKTTLWKLIDFTIAAIDRDARQDVTMTMRTGTDSLAAIEGTPHFMSPEQFIPGLVVNRLTDLWSLGVVMFVILKGSYPFAPHSEVDRNKISYAVVNMAAPVAQEIGVVSAGMSEVIKKALKNDRRDRFASAQEMASALRLRTDLPGHWAVMKPHTAYEKVDVSREDDQQLWERVEDRIHDSLPDFDVSGIQRVQNKDLWRKYAMFRDDVARQHGEKAVQERDLFHFAQDDDIEKMIDSSSVGFDSRLGKSCEYGAGTCKCWRPAPRCLACTGLRLTHQKRDRHALHTAVLLQILPSTPSTRWPMEITGCPVVRRGSARRRQSFRCCGPVLPSAIAKILEPGVAPSVVTRPPRPMGTSRGCPIGVLARRAGPVALAGHLCGEELASSQTERRKTSCTIRSQARRATCNGWRTRGCGRKARDLGSNS